MRWVAVTIFCLLVTTLTAQSSTNDSLQPIVLLNKQQEAPPKSIGQRDTISTDSYLSPPDYSPATNKKNLDQFLQTFAVSEKDNRQQMYIRWGLAIIFTALLVFAILRKRK